MELHDINCFSLPLKFIRKIDNYEITLNKVIEKQAKLKNLINKLNNYGARNLEKIEEKNLKWVLKSVEELFDARDDIIDFFKKEFFRIKIMYLKKKKKRNQKKN